MIELVESIDKTNPDWWKEFTIPWGKHEGWTMFQVYKNDMDYCHWLSENASDEGVKAAACAAVEHKNNVDPFSWT